MNWRKPVMNLGFKLLGYDVFKNYHQLIRLEYAPKAKLDELQRELLGKLLRHAEVNVPYYKEILNDCGVIKGNDVKFENFDKIPVLTKDIIRQQGEKLHSVDKESRSWHSNSSGGSTGEPVVFVQDKDYHSWGWACRLYYNQMAGKLPGQRELKLWGSERDILHESEKLVTKLRRWGFNIKFLNSFNMTDEIMAHYVNKWNEFKPETVSAYTSSIYEFSRYIESSESDIYSPGSITCTAETLTEDTRSFIEDIFKCPVLNQYGSREVGVVACECKEKEGLHLFPLNNIVEILNNELKPCRAGEVGNIYVTTLHNYSMPFIRYNIGDMAVSSEKKCSCGRSFSVIEKVVGRSVEVFKTRDGKVVPSQFFIHFVGVVYNKGYIEKFQVIQEDYDRIVIKVIIKNKGKFKQHSPQVINSIKEVMGQGCEVKFEIVDKIPPSKSGKYQYTICRIPVN